MAWANKYLFKFKSIHGVEYSIYILQDGYSGSVIQRALGRAPILRKKKNGSICGTSLEIYAECSVDGEFTEFYTSDPKEYRVDLYRANTLIWSGFISPELYSEPSIAPPYDVQIVAVDGLGELKLHQFIPQGVTRVKSLLAWILEWTGKSRGIVAISSLGYTNGTAADFLDNVAINLDFMAGESCYDVLETLLRSLHATITTYEDKWLIVRETDLSVSQAGTIAATAINNSGVVSSTTIVSAKKTVGKMGVADAWPIQNLSTKIEPALSKVTMLMPWHLVNFLDDPKFEKEQAQSAWVAPPFGTSVWVIRFPNFVEYKDESHEEITFEYDKPVYLLNNYPISDDRLYQQRQLVSFTTGFRLTISVCSLKQLSVTPNNLVVNISFTPTGGSPMYYLKDGWSSEEPSRNTQNQYFPMQRYSWEDYSVDVVPPYVEGPGTLKIEIRGYDVIIREVTTLMSPGNKGYKDTLVLNNGARGSGEDTELIGGRMLDGHVLRADCAQGIFLLNGAAITSYHDSRWSNADFLSITALGYAYSSALPRIRTEGKIDVPSGFSDLPLIVETNVDSIIETYDWDLYNEEATISALSLPTGEITVEHETVEEITGTSGSADTGLGSGSSSGGGGGSYGDMFFELDLDHTFTSGKRAVKLKDEYGGLWTKGFLTAGGVGQSSSGGGGVDIVRVWKSLQNQDTINTYNAYKISTAHLPTLGTGLAYTDNQEAGTSLETTLGIASGYKLPTTEEWNSVAGSVEALQSLQAQIDSVASRDNFDELTATALFADVLAASDIYGELHGNAETASYLVGSSYSAGSDSVPVYFSGGRPVACTASSLFASLTSATQKNLSITIAGQTREIAALYATYDGAGNTITAHYATASALNGVSNRVTALEGRQNWDEIFGLDENGNVYVKKNGNAARGFWTYGFVTAGGVGTGGGGGGGDVDLTRLWKSLQNQDTINTYNAYKISTAHLPTLGTGLAYTDNQGTGTGLTTTLSIASGYKLPTTEEWANVADNLNSLQALQAQIDSVATRDNFDELTASALFSDIVAGTTGYFETVYGSLEGNASSATYATSAGSATSAGYASSAGSATYDSDSENISTCFSTVSAALKSLQSQIDSVATKNAFDELVASVISADTIAAASFFGSLHGNADSATNATNAAYATYDTASENIASNFTTVGTALKSLQAQIDSVAANRAFDELTVTAGYFDMLSVGANLNVAGTIYSVKGIYSSGYVTAGAVGASSDERLKDDITTISEERAKDVIMALRPCEWVWNEKHSTLEGRKFAGLIAQEVQKVLPDAVLDSREELLLFHNVFHGYEIRMLQDHERRIKALELARE